MIARAPRPRLRLVALVAGLLAPLADRAATAEEVWWLERPTASAPAVPEPRAEATAIPPGMLTGLPAPARDGPYYRPGAPSLPSIGVATAAPAAPALATPGPAPGAPILPTVAVLLPLSGDYATFGDPCLEGIKLALGTEGAGRPLLRTVVVDTKGSAPEAAAAFQRAIADPNVIAVLGPMLSWELDGVEPLLRGAPIPVVTFSQRRVAPGSSILRFSMTREDQAAALADYVVSELQLDTWAVLHPEDSYGDDLAANFKTEVVRRGGAVSAVVGYDAKTVDFQPEVKKLRAALGMKEGDAPAIDGVFIPDSVERAAVIVPFLAYQDLRGVRLLGASSWNRLESLQRSAEDLSGAIFVDGFFLHSFLPEVRRFVDAYRDAYASDPAILAAYGYDAAKLVSDAFGAGGIDRESMARALFAPRSLRGATGLSVIRGDGRVDRSLFLLQWQDGALAELERRHPLGGKALREAPVSRVAPPFPRPSFDSRQVPEGR